MKFLMHSLSILTMEIIKVFDRVKANDYALFRNYMIPKIKN